MSKINRPSASASAYAQALIELADERRELEGTAADLKSLGETLDQSPELQAFFTNPGITIADRDGLIERVITPRVSSLTANFIKLLSSKGKLSILREVGLAFHHLMDARHGKVEVEVKVAKALTQSESEVVRQRISTALKKEAIVHQTVDESILGGIVIRVGDQLIDGSIATQLATIRTRMLAAK